MIQATIVTMPTKAIRLIGLREVMSLVGLRKSAIYDWISRGLFPQPVHLGSRCVRWPEAEVHRWIAERLAEREARAA
jgi:prophage regulatory protein